METVLIADDEKNIREGLKCILDWESLGFHICGEASNGEDALSGILQNNPSLVLLDIRMPKLTGIDIIRIAREQGYEGKFIILSGYSDFAYAQAAIRYGVDFYLTKPIDEDELLTSIQTIKQNLEEARLRQNHIEIYRTKAKDVILLKGQFAIHKFEDFLQHYEKKAPQAGSPLDSLFLAYGRPVRQLDEIYLSYEEAHTLMQRRFFCIQGQHTLGYRELPNLISTHYSVTDIKLHEYCDALINNIQASNRKQVASTLFSLEEYLYNVDASIESVKLFLTDLLLQLKESCSRLNRNNTNECSMPSNSIIIDHIDSCHYLYEIILYISEQVKSILDSQGGSSRESVLDDILYYIDNNYQTNIKLETIAPLFGYNSAYLGKIFTKATGQTFNSYIDHMRIEHSKELLLHRNMKVYEIAEQVGYHNVDYFHKKFKKYVGISPAEYRKQSKES